MKQSSDFRPLVYVIDFSEVLRAFLNDSENRGECGGEFWSVLGAF